jgi:hypothetical protein
MWNISGKTVAKERFEPFLPVEVLDDYDGPRIFTLQDAEGELNLAYWSDGDEKVCRYVVVPTTATILEELRKGGLSIYDALNQPRCWLCDVTHQGDLSACQRVEFEAIPRESLPAIGTMLLPTLEPLLMPRAEAQLVDWEGRIRELDKDRLSFELREIAGTPPTQRFVFDEQLLEEVFQAFEEDARVQVAGRTFPVKNLAYALTLSRVPATET